MNTRSTRRSLGDNKFLNPPPLCSACMSSDRTLQPLGVNTSIFIKLFDNNYLHQSVISLCWECTAVLNKIRIFKNKVDHAQKVLSFHCLSGKNILPPTTLSPLTPTTLYVISIKRNITKVESSLKYEEDIENDKYKVDSQTESGTYVIEDLLENDGYEAEFLENQDESNKYDIEEKRESHTYEYQTCSYDDDKREENDGFQTKTDQINNICEVNNQKNDKCGMSKKRNYFESDTPHNLCLDDVDAKNPEGLDKNYPDSTDDTFKHSELPLTYKRRKREPNEKTQNFNKKKRTTRSKKPHLEYTTLRMLKQKSRSEQMAMYTKIIPISSSELPKWIEQDKKCAFFSNLKSKCEKCVCHIPSNDLAGHMKLFHTQTERRKLICDYCECTFSCKRGLRLHLLKHTRIRQCLLCEFKCYSRDRMKHHLRDHMRQFRCNHCNALFSSKPEFSDHYQAMHSEFICDYCGEKFNKKRNIASHIIRLHSPIRCKKCNKSFKEYEYYQFHYERVHVENKTEDAFCVTCDRQFMNPTDFKYHIMTSLAHAAEHGNTSKKERVRCPECPKTYNCRSAMLDHYHYVHKGQSRYICQYCKNQFMNKARLREHTRKVHLGLKPEKNKICTYCGRGFSDNRVLTHHIRTHTGERPYKCEQCDARFAQRTPWLTHMKKHLK